MKRVLFVCHGNICRSPMAQYIFQDMVNKKGLENMFEIDSAATSTEEIGNPVYPPAYRILTKNGITGITHRARQVKRSDYDYYDYIFVMDSNNLRNIKRIIPDDCERKIRLLIDPEEIEDPWYTGDFETVYRQIEKGCFEFLQSLSLK